MQTISLGQFYDLRSLLLKRESTVSIQTELNSLSFPNPAPTKSSFFLVQTMDAFHIFMVIIKIKSSETCDTFLPVRDTYLTSHTHK